MTKSGGTSRFEAKLLRPAKAGTDQSWSFLVLPKPVSDMLPRRGRTTVSGSINGHSFQATLEPDGQLSHWLKVDGELRRAAGVEIGDLLTLEIAPMNPEPEPEIPSDLRDALAAAPEAQRMWDDTTTIARVDWIHWVTSAKQQKTREKRVENACDMLASGKRRVCCFDPSGFYSKSLSAPSACDEEG
ncbi:YdeI/OmpD-associated family protein [Verrucomicrobiaceae bacterium 227]